MSVSRARKPVRYRKVGLFCFLFSFVVSSSPTDLNGPAQGGPEPGFPSLGPACAQMEPPSFEGRTSAYPSCLGHPRDC